MELIFLIGPPGSGKTVCGQELARILGCAFYDTDKLIESRQKSTVTELFQTHGEPYFRQLEADLVERLQVESRSSGKVVYATGGGLPIYNRNIDKLQKLGKVVALSATLSVLCKRIRNNQERPLLASKAVNADKVLQESLSQLIEKRSPVYDRAGYKIDTTGLKPAQVAQEIIKVLNGSR